MTQNQQETLPGGLVMHPVRDERDAGRYVALSAAINGEHEGVMCTRLLRRHPATHFDDFVLVEDPASGEVVSTTCLIPWQLNVSGVTLSAAMLEMVVTHPAYRKRGLVRAQIERFHRAVAAREFDLSIIQGIPYYYRQFGYAYALDHRPYDALPVSHIPTESASPYQLRPATAEDAPTLTALHHASLSAHDVYTLREPAFWRFLIDAAQFPVRLVEDTREGRAAGYVIARPQPEQGRIDVSENGGLNHEAALAVLSQLKAELGGAGELMLAGTPAHALVRAARSLGSTPEPRYQWLLRIRDVAALLAKIGPLFERRLAASDCAGLTADVCVNLYHAAYQLRFNAGRLAGVGALGFVDASLGADGGDLCIPPDAFTRLVFGYRTLDELADAWPDIVVRPRSRHVLDVLFPRMTSCVWMPY
jgi:predicted acetyltransferase